MKKIKLLLIAVFTTAITSAQVVIKPGVKGGLNYSGLTNAGNDTKWNTSFHIGGSVSFKFADFYTLQPEVLYSKQGAKVGFDLVSNGGSYIERTYINTKLNYLSFHVNNKFFLGGGNFNLQVAPVLDILVSHENVNDPEIFDFGLAGGIGYNFPNGLNIDVRFKQGLTDLFGRNVGTYPETTDISDLTLNQVFQVSLGYEFDFK
ncbi:porin family protein [Tenacibaculum caenipelagi]|uniref:Outer membrane protein with beta-barrel domain n=1 Tax=Tenacibaculum caenipelagi TaxID=1325435 RepID=A0A4V6PW93_9FLAO|nr:porin family protein [Tenacibaculum caenipelagi]TDQ28864.1 outer membrane protein with beta-barrel domain [Tenacibaculum caenipelagi]